MAFDVIGLLPITGNGNIFILMMIDYFSKWAEAYVLPNHKAETVADCIFNRWITHHGILIMIQSDNAPEFRGHVITQLKKMLFMKGTFMMSCRPQSNWKETNIPVNLMYGTLKSRIHLNNYDCFCSYVEELRNSLVSAYFRTRKCLGDAAVRQKMYYDRDTAPRHFKKGDWVIYWHKPTAMQTLSSGWTGPFIVAEKVSVVDYRIQLHQDGSSKVVHVDQLILDPCHQDRTNWIRGELA